MRPATEGSYGYGVPLTPGGWTGSFAGLGGEGFGRSTPLYRYRGGRSAVLSKSELPIVHPRAPPVGTYEVPRIMDEILPDKSDIFGHKRTSSFKSSGRSRPLMHDAIHYATKRDDEIGSNLGPGSYFFSDSWGPDNRMTVTRVPHMKMQRSMGGVSNADRPWKQPAPVLLRNNKPVSSALSRKSLESLNNGSVSTPAASTPNNSKLMNNAFGSSEDIIQLQKDIEAVRSLPHYG